MINLNKRVILKESREINGIGKSDGN